MKNLIYVLIAITIAGCSKGIYMVNSDTGKKEGIPFLTKTVQLEQQTTYAQPYFDVALKVEPLKNDSLIPGLKPMSYQPKRTEARDNETLMKLQVNLQKYASVTVSQLDEVLTLYFALPDIKEDPAGFDTISNIVTRNVVVSKEMYYLNGRKSAFDSSSMNFELNADNTLTKGEASISSDYSVITEALTSVIPVSSLISKVFKLDKDEGTEDEEKELKNLDFPDIQIEEIEDLSFRITLTITGGVVQYTFTKPVESYEEAQAPLKFSMDDSFFIRNEISSKSTKTETKENKEENAVKINGSIVFPDKK